MEKEKEQKELDREENGKIRVGGGAGKWEKLAPYYLGHWQNISLFCQISTFYYLSY